VFVAATANEVERLPPELARRGRFDEVFFVDLPSPAERSQILAVHLRRRGRDPAAFRVAELARTLEHWSGAEIEQMVSA
jgi:SpoVK/Ycf46/Vps4 family AAA+-type ATPase